MTIRKKNLETLGKIASISACILVVGIAFCLIGMICVRGVAIFSSMNVDLADLFKTTWDPHVQDAQGHPRIGALAAICGSMLTTVLAAVCAFPLAIALSVFIVEIAPAKFGSFIRGCLELLLGIPSVVYGLIGLEVIVPFVRNIAPGQTGYSIFSAACVLVIMILPTITSLSIEALTSVSNEMREASYALGSTRMQTVWHLVLKTARPMLLTALILGIARAFGEALAVQMVIGNVLAMPTSLFAPATTLTSVITMGMTNEALGTFSNNALWTLALVLLCVSLFFVSIVHIIRHKASKHV